MAIKSYALTTRQRLIDFLGLSSSSLTTAKENVLDRIIDSATEYIENYCGRRFKKTTYSNELYDGNDSGQILLKNYPIISSESFGLDIRNSALNEGGYTSVETNSYIVDYDSGVVSGMSGFNFIKGRGLYRASYTAGYDFDNSTTFLSDTQAGDVEYAMWKLCAAMWNKRKGSMGVSSESLGDYAVTYAKTAFEDEEIKAILDKYSRMDVGGGITPNLY